MRTTGTMRRPAPAGCYDESANEGDEADEDDEADEAAEPQPRTFYWLMGPIKTTST